MQWTRAFLVISLAACPTAARSTDVECGATVVTDLQLTSDLLCPGEGLIAGAAGIPIFFNALSIAGAGAGVGIRVAARLGVEIRQGTIRGFATAVRVTDSSDLVIAHNELAGNAEGIDFQAGSIGNTVKENRFTNSTIRAMMLRSNSSDNDIKDNAFTGNRVGILVFGGVENTIKDNDILGSALAGVRFNVIATGNMLKDNRIGANAAGVEFLVTPTGSAVGNEVKDNTFAANACGIKGPSAGNTIKGTRFDGNTADTCS